MAIVSQLMAVGLDPGAAPRLNMGPQPCVRPVGGPGLQMVRYAATHWLRSPPPHGLPCQVFTVGSCSPRLCLELCRALNCDAGQGLGVLGGEASGVGSSQEGCKWPKTFRPNIHTSK